MKKLVDTWLRQALARLPDSVVPASGRAVRVEVRRPQDPRLGDFASNLALRLASAVRCEARPLAEAIKSALPADAALAKVEIAGAGFLNFFLSESSYHDEIRGALQDAGDFGRSDLGQGRALKVEVASVDPEGPRPAIPARLRRGEREIRARGRVGAFREILEQSTQARAPHLLAQYLSRLAHDFHRYYAAHPLVVADASLRDARLALASAVQVVLRNGLRLLGVAAPETV